MGPARIRWRGAGQNGHFMGRGRGGAGNLCGVVLEGVWLDPSARRTREIFCMRSRENFGKNFDVDKFYTSIRNASESDRATGTTWKFFLLLVKHRYHADEYLVELIFRRSASKAPIRLGWFLINQECTQDLWSACHPRMSSEAS